jgi:hypothetical protein
MSTNAMTKMKEFKERLEAKRLGRQQDEATKETKQETIKTDFDEAMSTPKQTPKQTKPEGTREAWLERAAQAIRQTLKQRFDIEAPEFKVSVGFATSAARQSRRMVGQCVIDDSSALQVFVSPVAEKSHDALTILLTQTVHALVMIGYPNLKDLALRIGMTVNDDNTKHGGAPFIANAIWSKEFDSIIASNGAYPHVSVSKKHRKSRDSGGTRIYCERTGYKGRIAPVWIKKFGAPSCPCCETVMKIGK